jgi:hypothetical protein
MTLSTEVYVQGWVNQREVFAFCQGLLAQHDDQQRTPDQQITEDSSWSGKTRCLMTRGGQGLPAWLMVTYNPSGPYRTDEEQQAHDEDCNIPGNEYYDADEPVCDGSSGYPHEPACWVLVDFDTAYGYTGANGWGCGSLHAWLVAELGQWLDARNIPWSWQNEFTGEIHTGYENLKDLGEGGLNASTWFRSTVLPAIESGLI